MIKRKKLRTCYLLMMITTALCFTASLIALSVEDESKKYDDEILQKGVALIIKSETVWGSGVAVGIKGEPVEYVLTCYHCVYDSDTDSLVREVTVNSGGYKNADEFSPAEVVYTDKDHDIALLKLKNKFTSMIPLTFSKETPELGSRVFALGYPGEGRFGLEDAKSKGISHTGGELVNGGVDLKTTEGIPYKDMYMMTARIAKGYSGGPTFDSRGYVIGLSSASNASIDNGAPSEFINSYASKISYVTNVLDDMGIGYASSDYDRRIHTSTVLFFVTAAVFLASCIAAPIIKQKLKITPRFRVEEQSLSDIPSNIKQIVKDSEQLFVIGCDKNNIAVFNERIGSGQIYKLFFKGNAAANFCIINGTAAVKCLDPSLPINAVVNVNEEPEKIKPDDNNEVTVEVDKGYVLVGSGKYYIKFKRED